MKKMTDMVETLKELADATGPVLFHKVMDVVEDLTDDVKLLSDQNRALKTELEVNGRSTVDSSQLGGEQLITADKYQRAALRTAGDNKSEWLENAIYGIVGETGEIVDLVKKHKWQGHPLDPEQIALEAGDLLWYVSLLASAIGVNLSYVMTKNIEKLQKRYPEGFSSLRSMNRTE